MALKSLVLFSLLVLVLLVLVEAQTSWLKFKNEHMDPGNGPFDHKYCNLKKEKFLGKDLNTLVHASLEEVQAVCYQPNIRCLDGSICHKSKSLMNITECRKIQGTSDYLTYNKRRHIVIACSGEPLEPVHYDHSEEVSSEVGGMYPHPQPSPWPLLP